MKSRISENNRLPRKKIGVMILIFVVFILGIYTVQFSKQQEDNNLPENHPQFEIKSTKSYNYADWKEYTYSAGDYDVMVPPTYVVKEIIPNPQSPCGSSVNIGKKNSDDIAEIQINKCPEEINKTYSLLSLYRNENIIMDINLGGVYGRMKQGSRSTVTGDVKSQTFIVYNNGFEYSIFRILDDSTITDEQFSQLLSSFKFHK